MTTPDRIAAIRAALEQSILDLSYYIHLATKVKTNNKWIACEIYKITMSLERLEKILAHLDALEKEREWQPIETAPKDGRKILLAKISPHLEIKRPIFAGASPDVERKGFSVWWAVSGFWSDKWKNWNNGVEPSGLASPTHWKPIDPPTIAGCKQQRGGDE